MNNEIGKRITLKRTRPNPLFQEWLEELYEDAKAKQSRLEPMLKEALESLSKYPLPLNSGAECAVLKGFKKKLCDHLDQRLQVYRHNQSLEKSSKSSSSASTCSTVRTCSSPLSDLNEIANINTVTPQNSTSKNTQPDTQPQTDVNPQPTDIQPQRTHSNSTSNSQKSADSTTDTNSPQPSPSSSGSKKSRGRKYKPAYKSGAYAILVGLLKYYQKHQNEPALTKEELIDIAQKYSEESFIRPKPDTYYTAWSNMPKLVTKGLVIKVRNKKVKYQLTAEGLELAKEVLSEYKNRPSVNDIIFNDAPSSSRVTEEIIDEYVDEPLTQLSQESNIPVIELPAGSFDIILLIDKNETGGVSKKNDPTVAQFKKYPDLNHEYRSLKVGDFTWIARHKVNKDQELVLPYVIERKRMDDLGASIKDGRFHEQKFRLRKCGLKHVVYLVENYGGNKNVGLPIQHLMQGLANTRIQDGFKVHITESLTNSARFLAMMTKRLTIRFKDRNLKGRADESSDEYLMSFDYFNKASKKSKALTVTETFIKLLLQLKGVSVEKALAITSKYSTPKSLIVAYQRCDRSEGEYLLANLKYNGTLAGRNVGPVVSKAIYQLFTSYGGQ